MSFPVGPQPGGGIPSRPKAKSPNPEPPKSQPPVLYNPPNFPPSPNPPNKLPSGKVGIDVNRDGKPDILITPKPGLGIELDGSWNQGEFPVLEIVPPRTPLPLLHSTRRGRGDT
jgi:hypothetical protein